MGTSQASEALAVFRVAIQRHRPAVGRKDAVSLSKPDWREDQALKSKPSWQSRDKWKEKMFAR